MVRVAGLKRRDETGPRRSAAPTGSPPREQLGPIIATRTQDLVEPARRRVPRRRRARAGRAGHPDPALGATSPTTERSRLRGVLPRPGLPGAHPARGRPGAPVPLHLRAVAEPRRPGARPGRPAPSASPGSRCPTTCRGSCTWPTDEPGVVFLPLEDLIAAHLDQLFPGMEVVEAPPVPGHPQRRPRGRGGPRRGPAAGAGARAGPAPVRARRCGSRSPTRSTEHVLELLLRELDVDPDDVVTVPGPARPRRAVAALRRSTGPTSRTSRSCRPPTRAFAEGETPSSVFATLREGDVLRAPPLRLVRHERAALHRAGRRRPERAGDQADALPHLRRLPDRRRADRRGRGRQAGRGAGGDQGPLRRAGQHPLGARRWSGPAATSSTAWSGSRRTARPRWWCARRAARSAATATSAPATTTRRPRGSTRTSACSPPTRRSAPTSPTCSTSSPATRGRPPTARCWSRRTACGAGIVERIEREIEARTATGRPTPASGSRSTRWSTSRSSTRSTGRRRPGCRWTCVVRGICALRPGRARACRRTSGCGRSSAASWSTRRVFYFGDGATEYWIGSADLMHRNLDRRVEVLLRVADEPLAARLGEVLDSCLDPATRCWTLGADGAWSRRRRRIRGVAGARPPGRDDAAATRGPRRRGGMTVLDERLVAQRARRRPGGGRGRVARRRRRRRGAPAPVRRLVAAQGQAGAGETMPFAAVREVAEETGLDVHLGPMLGDVSLRGARGPQGGAVLVGARGEGQRVHRRRRGRRAALGPRRAGRRAAHLRPRPGRAAALRGPRPPHVDDPAGAARQGGQPQPVGRRRRRAAAVASGREQAAAPRRAAAAVRARPDRERAAAALPRHGRAAGRGARAAGRRRAAAGRGRLLGAAARGPGPPAPARRRRRASPRWQPGRGDPGRRARAGAELAATGCRSTRRPCRPARRARGCSASRDRCCARPTTTRTRRAERPTSWPSCAPGPPSRSALVPSCAFLAALAALAVLRRRLGRGGLRRGRLGAPWSWPRPPWPAWSPSVALVALAGFAWPRPSRGLGGRFHRGRGFDRPGAGRACGGALAPPPTAVLNPVPGRNAGTVAAGTATVSPVRGLRPTRAARARASKTPKPVSDTDSPALTVSTMVDSSPSTADAAVRRSPRRAASASMSWDLFMVWRP